MTRERARRRGERQKEGERFSECEPRVKKRKTRKKEAHLFVIHFELLEGKRKEKFFLLFSFLCVPSIRGTSSAVLC